MKPLIAILSLVVLAGCGADGAPVRPTLKSTVAMDNGGLHTSATLAAHKGPVSLSWSLRN